MPVSPQLEHDLIAIMRAAATAEILPRFRNLKSSEIATKSHPGDLVTAADILSERMMTAQIPTVMPDALVVGEEAISENPALRADIGRADPCVILDPVDGTWNFTKGVALFGMILAVARGQVPEFGVLYDPVTQDWVVAHAGQPTRFVTADGFSQTTQTSSETDIACMTGFVPFEIMARHHRQTVTAAMDGFAGATALRCSCHEYRMIARGQAEFLVSHHIPNPWDHAAGVVAVRGAGGVARFIDGEDYNVARRHGYLVTAANEDIWQLVADRFRFLQADAKELAGN
ncbi:putative inositol monophosphatase protein [Ketogulonicigenium robustum]|uniref:Putative inositol monophosphatase protein n=1 Tax=Ketogulonicigenium robustum TaxID=92947 RepID=A0A1W6P0X4_9RHOB|nr:inositol monophosphatase [Ketogulonicigenium robustum]ARO15158.1 putative inositol monophosphatase protein [Ketogulonicigenium robustum]